MSDWGMILCLVVLLGMDGVVRVLLCLGLILVHTGGADALKHDLKIKKDSRGTFFIENFGFEAGGEMHMDISGFTVGKEPLPLPQEAGFLIKRTETDSAGFIEEAPATAGKDCWAYHKELGEIVQPDKLHCIQQS